MRLARLLGLGLLGGIAAGTVARRLLPSRGGPESTEVELNAVVFGVALRSRAQGFRGGRIRAWVGGVALDLREATLAPEARLELSSVLGGIAIHVPPGWRVEADVRAIGGVAVDVPEPDDPAAPVLRVDGFSLLGGVAVVARPRPE